MDLVHARASPRWRRPNRRDAVKIVRKALRPEWLARGRARNPRLGGHVRGGVNNAERAAIADAVLGVEVLPQPRYLVLERSRSAYEDTAPRAARGWHELHAILREASPSPLLLAVLAARARPRCPPRRRRRDKRSYWMTHRVVSNEFARDYLAVLRGAPS